MQCQVFRRPQWGPAALILWPGVIAWAAAAPGSGASCLARARVCAAGACVHDASALRVDAGALMSLYTPGVTSGENCWVRVSHDFAQGLG